MDLGSLVSGLEDRSWIGAEGIHHQKSIEILPVLEVLAEEVASPGVMGAG
jgi:hypothetical protein